MRANLLAVLGVNLASFLEAALSDKANWSDFDSAIPRFESWRPSQHRSRSSVRQLESQLRTCKRTHDEALWFVVHRPYGNEAFEHRVYLVALMTTDIPE